MLVFILRRLLQAMVVMVAVAFIAFLLFQYVGDPVVFLLGQDARPEQIRELLKGAGLTGVKYSLEWKDLAQQPDGADDAANRRAEVVVLTTSK